MRRVKLGQYFHVFNYAFTILEDIILKLGYFINFMVPFPAVSMNFQYQLYIEILNYRDNI